MNCPRCRSMMNFVQQYNQWYCSYCQQYQQPAPAPSSPPAPAPAPIPPPQPAYHQYPPPQQPPASQSNIKMVIGTILIVAIVIVVAIFLAISPTFEDSSETKTMTMQELVYDEWDSYDMDFRNLEPGDTLRIKDTIIFRYYSSWEDATVIQFTGGSLEFRGDLRDEFHVYDEVIVTLHIKGISYYGYEMEWFEEGLSGNHIVPLSADTIKHA